MADTPMTSAVPVWGADMSEANTAARKGRIFGECGTAGCTNVARWISIHEARSAPQPFTYRCPPCCDRIDERMAP